MGMIVYPQSLRFASLPKRSRPVRYMFATSGSTGPLCVLLTKWQIHIHRITQSHGSGVSNHATIFTLPCCGVFINL
jgi:hypothetical protein